MTDAPAEPTPDEPHGELGVPADQPAEPQGSELDWKAEARKWEQRAKDNKTKADRADELERASMTDQQRIERERDEARQERDGTKSELARMRAAIKYGLDEDDLDLLGTGTDDEIDARAKRLSDRIGAATTTSKRPASRQPAAQLRGGGEPAQEPEETDPRKLAARVPRN